MRVALRLAGALLKMSEDSFNEFAARLAELGAAHVIDAYSEELRVDDYKKSLRALLSESWDRLPKDRPELADIMRTCACSSIGSLDMLFIQFVDPCVGGNVVFPVICAVHMKRDEFRI